MSAIDTEAVLQRVLQLLPRHAYHFNDENGLQRAVSSCLTAHGIDHRREVVAGPQDRFDILVPPGIVLELKTAQSLPAAMPQVLRYLERDDVHTVVLVTNRLWALQHATPVKLAGKLLHLLKIQRSAF